MSGIIHQWRLLVPGFLLKNCLTTDSMLFFVMDLFRFLISSGFNVGMLSVGVCEAYTSGKLQGHPERTPILQERDLKRGHRAWSWQSQGPEPELPGSKTPFILLPSPHPAPGALGGPPGTPSPAMDNNYTLKYLPLIVLIEGRGEGDDRG